MKGFVSFIAGVCCFFAMSGQSLAIDLKVEGLGILLLTTSTVATL